MNTWTLFSDGASRGNPGPAGAGAYLITPDGSEIKLTKYLGIKTNNQAEYEALILGLEELVERGAKNVKIRADSEFMIRQLLGEYRVKHEGIKPLFETAKMLLEAFDSIDLKHIPREENTIADELSNDAIDDHIDL